MASPGPRRRFECAEAGCSAVLEAATEDELIEVVQRHMREEHDTFELEDVILDNATTVE
jgi:predicted small metal-binding protein